MNNWNFISYEKTLKNIKLQLFERLIAMKTEESETMSEPLPFYSWIDRQRYTITMVTNFHPFFLVSLISHWQLKLHHCVLEEWFPELISLCRIFGSRIFQEWEKGNSHALSNHYFQPLKVSYQKTTEMSWTSNCKAVEQSNSIEFDLFN